MKTLEIIQLRSTIYSIDSLNTAISESIKAKGEPSESVSIFRRDGLETDLAVHIHRSEASGEGGPSELGVRLASALKDYGLVEHTLWEVLK